MSRSTAAPAPAATAPHASGAASDWLLVVLPGLIWGASFLFIAEGLTAVEPFGLTFARILVGFLTLSLFPAARKPLQRTESGGSAWPQVALLGLLWMAFPLNLFPFAEQRISSALTGMLNGLVPLVAAAVAAFLARKTPSRGVLAGLAVGLGGAVLMGVPSLREGGNSFAGVVMILIAVTSYGFAVNLARPLQQRHGALPVLWRALGFSLVLNAPLGIPDLLRAEWNPWALISILALGAGGTGIAFVLTATAAGKLGATRASSTTFLTPPVALLLGVLVRNESVAWIAVVGGITCVVGAWLIRRAQTAAPAVATTQPAPVLETARKTA
jgi:drug/metabolite transporter (DMT)-like permease